MLSKIQQQAIDGINSGVITHENELIRACGISRSMARTTINSLVSLGLVAADPYGGLTDVDTDLLAMGDSKPKQKPTEKRIADEIPSPTESPVFMESTPSGDDKFHDQFIASVDVPSYRATVEARPWPTPESPKPQFHELVKRGLARLNQQLHCQSFRIEGVEEKAATLKELASTLAKFDGGHLSAMLHNIANDYKLIAEAQNESIKD